MDTIEQAQFDALLEKLTLGSRAAVAVSGGRDSTALMHLLAASSVPFEDLTILTVDHRLRAASSHEAAQVAEMAQRLNLNHVTLAWSGEKPKSGIQEAARHARYELMTDWCRSRGVHDLYLAHTEDDQAETILMRLVRGSGVDGLAAMSPVTERGGVRLLRPLLGVSREALTSFLQERSICWIDDPSNEDVGYARVRMRTLLADLHTQGLTRDRLARTAEHMSRAREALAHYAQILWNEIVTVHETGYVTIECAALKDSPDEIGLRVLSRALQMVGGQTYRPRFEKLASLFESISKGERVPGRTLAGCAMRDDEAGRMMIARELRAVVPAATPVRPGQKIRWDNRFLVELAQSGVHSSSEKPDSLGGYSIRPLGENGWRAVRDQAQTKLPNEVRLALPSLWIDEEVEAVPHLGVAHPVMSKLGLAFSARFLGLLPHES